MQQGSTGNVIAALASFCIPGLGQLLQLRRIIARDGGDINFCIPGLGQLLQGRALAALGFFLLSVVLWGAFLGWIIHIVACFEAAVYKGKISTSL